jgi:hypothetical protein
MFSEEEDAIFEEETDQESEEDDPCEPGPITDPEEWQDYWSWELVTMYDCIREQAQKQGWSILDECSFHKFATFCYENSSKRKPNDLP